MNNHVLDDRNRRGIKEVIQQFDANIESARSDIKKCPTPHGYVLDSIENIKTIMRNNIEEKFVYMSRKIGRRNAVEVMDDLEDHLLQDLRIVRTEFLELARFGYASKYPNDDSHVSMADDNSSHIPNRSQLESSQTLRRPTLELLQAKEEGRA